MPTGHLSIGVVVGNATRLFYLMKSIIGRVGFASLRSTIPPPWLLALLFYFTLSTLIKEGYLVQVS